MIAAGLSAGQCGCGSGLRSIRCCALDVSVVSPPGSAAVLLPLIEQAEQARRDGDARTASSLCLQVLELAPGCPPALTVFGHLHAAAGRLEAAAALFGRIVLLDPNNLAATCDTARTLFRRGDIAGAERHARNAVRLGPENADAHNLLAMVLTEMNRPVPGEHHYRRALTLSGERNPILLANLAWNLKTQGRMAESRALYQESLAAHPDELQTLLGFARMEEAASNLEAAAALLQRAAALSPENPAVTLAQAVVATRAGQQQDALAILDRMTAVDSAAPAVLMEKGRLLDRMGRHGDAFASWIAGKQALRTLTGQAYLADAAANTASRLKNFFTEGRRRLLPSAPPAPGPQPIFILGFPRSGTTLVEQSLSAHPSISAGDELPLIGDLAAMMPRVLSSPLPYPEALAELWMGDQEDGLATLRDHYLRRVQAMGIATQGEAWFTDKMPLNETHIGLISMVFPASPMIHLLRHPLDVVVSVFSNELTHGLYCAYALETVAEHYALTMDLVAYYRGALPLRYLPIRYEDMVDDQEATVRRMLEFVGMPYDPACLAFHENRRYARTASYAQVTEQLYASSRFRYRHYLRELEPVLAILEKTVAQLGYII